MPTTPKPPTVTIQELRGRADIPDAERERMEALAIRLIQIQDDNHKLRTERGYTEGREHFPGIADELEGLLIKHSVRGIVVEDFSVLATHGSNSRIDRDLLLAEGVDAATINAATVTSNWTGVSVRHKRDRDREG